MTSGQSLPAAYFVDIYARDTDPWQFASSAYEMEKYRTTLAALPKDRYRYGFEVGCSIGVLTRQLAARCEGLLAVDVSDIALSAARQRCRDLPAVQFEKMAVPDQVPDSSFDLIVVSEVAYYWSMADLNRMMGWLQLHLLPAGHLVFVHWIGETDYPVSGDAVHDRLLADRSFVCLSDKKYEKYRLSVARKAETSLRAKHW